jgi:hypothetical protein
MGEGLFALLLTSIVLDRIARGNFQLAFAKKAEGESIIMSASQPKRLRFHIMIDRETRQIARRLRDATQLRLFLLLPNFLRWDAWHPIDEARIAAEIEITPEELNKALAELVLHGLVLRNDTDYRRTVWLLSPVWGRKGSWTEVQANIAAETDRSRDADAA